MPKIIEKRNKVYKSRFYIFLMDHSSHSNGNWWERASNFKCICGKSYKYSSGLTKHKKTCDIEEKVLHNENVNTQFKRDFTELLSMHSEIMDIVERQDELNRKLAEKLVNMADDVIKLKR